MAQVEYQRSESALSTSSKSMSRLQLMQADLQRKMSLEKDEKMIKLYNDAQAKALDKVRQGSAPANYEGGTVRKYFNERRMNPNLDASMASLDSYLLNASHGRNGLNRSIGRPIKGSPVGWDKSYPLIPIERTNSGSSSGYESINGKVAHMRNAVDGRKSHVRRQSLERSKPNESLSGTMRRSKSQILDSSLTKSGPNSAHASKTSSPTRGRPPVVRDNRMKNEEKRKMELEMRKREQELITKIKQQQAEIDKMRQEKIKEEKAQKARLMRKPVPSTIKSNQPQPTVQQEICSPTKSTADESPPRTPRSATDDGTPRSNKSSAGGSTLRSYKSLADSGTSRQSASLSPKKVMPACPPDVKKTAHRPSTSSSDLPECNYCGRRFAPDRLEKHTQICSKTASKRRKVFDPVKMRTQGTEMESFVRKKGKTNAKEPPRKPTKPSNWREKHENFLQTIRQAKVVQQHVAAGGKVSDLPPPPPLDTSDYIQCPHCGRKFSQGAADRHVPKCQSIKSNKK